MIKCKLCEYKFENKNLLANHVRWHHKTITEFKCDCGRVFNDIGILKCHKKHCSDILKGIENKNVTHCAQLPFIMYDIKGENDRGSTRSKE